MHKSLTLDTVESVVAQDLQAIARQALERGEPVEFYLHPASPGVKGCILVETLVVGNRAGQVTNGNAVWGDWFPVSQTIVLDELGPQGEVLRASLDGTQQPLARPTEGFRRGMLTVLLARSGPKTNPGGVVDLFATAGGATRGLLLREVIDLHDPSRQLPPLSEKTLARIQAARRRFFPQAEDAAPELRVVKTREEARELGFHFEMGPERPVQIEVRHTQRPLLRVRSSLDGVEFSATEVLFVVGDADGWLPTDRPASTKLVREHGRPSPLANGGRGLQAWAPMDGDEPRWVPVALLD